MADNDPNRKSSSPAPSGLPNPYSLFVPASPPKAVSLEDMMKWHEGMKDLSIVHEIAVDNKFCIEHNLPDSRSVQGQIKEVMHRAFWDILESKLNEDPPDYSHALVLLQEIKEELVSLLLPQNETLRPLIVEVLDLDLIKQKAEHDALDFSYYSNFIIGVMSKMCAPVRDEQIVQLQQFSGVVPLYRAIFSVIDLMKLDMANFTIAQMRPFIQQHSVTYEQEKFRNLLKTQRENGIDGLRNTKNWLARNAERVREDENSGGTNTSKSQEDSTASSSASTEPASSSAVSSDACACASSTADSSNVETKKEKFDIFDNRRANAILNASYLECMHWTEYHQHIIPETLVLDGQRLHIMQETFAVLTFVSTVIAVTYGTIGEAIADLAELKQKLKVQIMILNGSQHVNPSNPIDLLTSIAEQVIKEVNICLVERGRGSLSADKEKMLKGQITTLLDANGHPVMKLMGSRLTAFISGIITNPTKNKEFSIPPGFSTVSDELSQVSGQFLRLITYNQMIYGTFYSDIIREIFLQQDAKQTALAQNS